MKLRKEGGYSPFEVIGGALILSIGISISYFLIDWMNGVKADRARRRNPLQQSEQMIKKVEPGEEFGSYVITFQL
ncbi:MAG: hypothetical protein KDD70_10550 [Bdellovibrionales bacterium]|nr:hypothetical protein [Bdellovibrionales bacterium]